MDRGGFLWEGFTGRYGQMNGLSVRGCITIGADPNIVGAVELQGIKPKVFLISVKRWENLSDDMNE